MLAVATLVTLLLAACSAIAPSRDDFVGTWANRTGQNRAVLVLRDNGSFRLDDVPEAVFDARATTSELDWNRVQDLTGIWSLNDDGSLRFKIDSTEAYVGYDTSLSTTGLGAGLKLTRRVGPIDNGVSFVFARSR